MQIGMPGKDQSFYFRDLADAAGDSRRDSDALGFDLFEGTTVAVERCFFASQLLPALDDDIDILRIKLDPATHPLGQLCRGKCRAAAEERIVHEFAAPRVIQDRPPHQLNGLLARMITFLFVGAAHNEFW